MSDENKPAEVKGLEIQAETLAASIKKREASLKDKPASQQPELQRVLLREKKDLSEIDARLKELGHARNSKK